MRSGCQLFMDTAVLFDFSLCHFDKVLYHPQRMPVTISKAVASIASYVILFCLLINKSGKQAKSDILKQIYLFVLAFSQI